MMKNCTKTQNKYYFSCHLVYLFIVVFSKCKKQNVFIHIHIHIFILEEWCLGLLFKHTLFHVFIHIVKIIICSLINVDLLCFPSKTLHLLFREHSSYMAAEKKRPSFKQETETWNILRFSLKINFSFWWHILRNSYVILIKRLK